MLELIVGVVGFAILTFAVWWTDRVKKHYNGDDYDG
jgi:hypothetical protein